MIFRIYLLETIHSTPSPSLPSSQPGVADPELTDSDSSHDVVGARIRISTSYHDFLDIHTTETIHLTPIHPKQGNADPDPLVAYRIQICVLTLSNISHLGSNPLPGLHRTLHIKSKTRTTFT